MTTRTDIPILVRIIVIIVGLKFTIPLAFMAVMMIAFTGSVHGLPDWAAIYIVVTQAIPLIVAFYAWLVLVFTCFMAVERKFWVKLMLSSLLIYGMSLGLLILILD